jgi:hypothetical protein
MPIARFQMPDGRVARFEVPEGTTPEQAQSLMAAQMGQEGQEGPATPPERSFMSDVKQGAGNLLAGAVRGAGSIGATILAPVDAAARALNGGKAMSIGGIDIVGQDRRTGMDEGLREMGAEPDSLMFKGGKLAGEIAGTAGAGGVLANTARFVAPSLAAAPRAAQFLNAVRTGGMSTGAPAATTMAGKAASLGTRTAAGATAGAAAAELVNPDEVGTGAMVGAALPGAVGVAGNVGGYIGRNAKAILQPFTQKGQERIAGDILNRFADGGPTAVNAGEIVPGSMPTLAEATGNAGLAGLQRTARDLRPNAFVEREAGQAAARSTALDNIAGDAAQLEFYKASRGQAAHELYDAALNRAPEAPTSYVKGQITQLLKRPSIDAASRVAQKWAIERGEKPAMNGSLRALHDVKTALDDKIAEAVQRGAGGEAKALDGTKTKLLDVMEKLSPEYGEARATYAAMSKPINEMEALQGLKLTDARGNITLSKIQNAIHGLEQQRAAPGFNNAKAIDQEKLKTLHAIRDDLLRRELTMAGKSAGSNTFQNIATDNILSNMLPGKIGGKVAGKVGDVFGQVGKLAYSGANEKIRNNLMDMMLDPAAAQAAMSAKPALTGAAAKFGGLLEQSYPWAYRSGPLLATDR